MKAGPGELDGVVCVMGKVYRQSAHKPVHPLGQEHAGEGEDGVAQGHALISVLLQSSLILLLSHLIPQQCQLVQQSSGTRE